MIESQRRAYLDALGFDVWVARPAEPARDRLVISPGRGSILLICDSPIVSVTKLAGDITRALGGSPVWAWPDPEGGPDSPTVEDAVIDRMFTRVIVFGAGLGEQLFGVTIPEILVSSAVSVTAAIDDLAVRGSQKKGLWELIRDWREEAR